MRHLKHCLNPKVIAALAAVAVGVWMFAPSAFAAALPLLIFAICPLSMVGMMYMMRGSGQGSGANAGADGHTQAAAKESVNESGKQDDGRAVELLRTRVAELESRLALKSRRDETVPGESAAGMTALSTAEVDARPPKPEVDR